MLSSSQTLPQQQRQQSQRSKSSQIANSLRRRLGLSQPPSLIAHQQPPTVGLPRPLLGSKKTSDLIAQFEKRSSPVKDKKSLLGGSTAWGFKSEKQQNASSAPPTIATTARSAPQEEQRSTDGGEEYDPGERRVSRSSLPRGGGNAMEKQEELRCGTLWYAFCSTDLSFLVFNISIFQK